MIATSGPGNGIFRFLRENSRALLSLVIVVPSGFFTKFYAGPAEYWMRNSLGGVFYEVFWCLVLSILIKQWSPMAIAGIVLVMTCVLEFVQLGHPPILQVIRGTFIGATILGTTLMWSDFPYYFIGSGIGWFWMRLIADPGEDHRGR